MKTVDVGKIVVAAVSRLGARRGLDARRVSLSASLVDDLDFDSLEFVDLTAALEDGLELPAFPLQSYLDREEAREGKRFTLEALIAMCQELSCDARALRE